VVSIYSKNLAFQVGTHENFKVSIESSYFIFQRSNRNLSKKAKEMFEVASYSKNRLIKKELRDFDRNYTTKNLEDPNIRMDKGDARRDKMTKNKMISREKTENIANQTNNKRNIKSQKGLFEHSAAETSCLKSRPTQNNDIHKADRANMYFIKARNYSIAISLLNNTCPTKKIDLESSISRLFHQNDIKLKENKGANLRKNNRYENQGSDSKLDL
jgi:hypothetical protein